MELRTARLVLRRPRADRAGAIAAACADPEIPRFIPFIPVPYTLADANAFVADCERTWRESDRRTFVVVDAASDELLGAVSVVLAEGGSVGYWLKREARGRGIATEAVAAAVAWALGHGGSRLFLLTHPDNVASQRVAEKCGFRRAGSMDDAPFRDGTREAFRFELP